MPKIDFSKIDDVDDYSPLPYDKYLCEVNEVVEDETQNGDEMYKLRFEVIQGEYKGRFIFDNLVFSEAAMKRVKLICSRLGLDVSGEVDITPDLLQGRKCYVTVLTEEYENDAGKMKKRNVVPFAGYEHEESESGEPGETGEDDGEGDIPF